MKVKESLEFKRGQKSKDALEVGRKSRIKTVEGLREALIEDLTPEGFEKIDVYTWRGKLNTIEFQIPNKIFGKKFKGEKRELTKFFGSWLVENTPFYLENFNRHGMQTLRNNTLWYATIREIENVKD